MLSNRAPVVQISIRLLFPATPSQSSSTFSCSSLGLPSLASLVFSTSSSASPNACAATTPTTGKFFKASKTVSISTMGVDDKMVIKSLTDGTMNGKENSQKEILELKDSSKWNKWL
jgi:hypothetical protein